MEHVLSSAAIRERRAALNKQIVDAKAQLADLDIAERILERFGQAVGEPRPNSRDMDDLLRDVANDAQAPSSEVKTHTTMTTRALFKSVLRQSSNVWMTANEIQERASAIKGQEVPMATVSPTLSNMKNAGVIVRDGMRVALASRLNEIGEAEASPSNADVSASDVSSTPSSERSS